MMAPAHKAIVAGLTFSITSATFAGKEAFALTSSQVSALTLPEYIAPFAVGFATGAVIVGAACAVMLKLEDKEYADGVESLRSNEAGESEKTHILGAAVEEPKVSAAPSTSKPESIFAGDASVTSFVPRTQSNDIVDVAQNYVERQTLAQRLKTQAKGVAAVLSERLGADRFDDLPVIQRADGTVGDVGTAWWNDRMGDQVLRVGAFEHDGQTAEQKVLSEAAISSHPKNADYRPLTRQRYSGDAMGNTSAIRLNEVLPGFEGVSQKPHINGSTAAAVENVKVAAGIGNSSAAEHVVSASVAATGEEIPVPVSIYGTGSLASSTASWKLETQLSAPPMKSTQSPRSRQILGRISEVDQGVFPKEREISDLDSDDMWMRAMGAMDEKINNHTPNYFEDHIGKVDTIDEIEGLEGKTNFIPFRTPAGHPEVVDTQTYVDYLINEEFGQNSSKAVRKSSRDYLRVIEGGSVPQNTRRLMRAARAAQALPQVKAARPCKQSSTAAEGSYKPRHMRPAISSPFADVKEA